MYENWDAPAEMARIVLVIVGCVVLGVIAGYAELRRVRRLKRRGSWWK